MGEASERRKHPRIKPTQPFSGHIRPKQPVAVVDLSRSGALLETAARLAPGQRCRLVLELEDRQLDLAIEVVRSHVHRIESLRGGESQIHYRAGIRFEQLAAEDVTAIVQFLARHAEAPAALTPEVGPGVSPGLGAPDAMVPEGSPRFKRRSFPRVQTSGLHGELQLASEGRVTSVSEGGIAIAVSSRIEEQKAIAVVVGLPGGLLRATGTVRYCRPLPPGESPGETFEVGIAFDPLKREQLEALRKLMVEGGL